jgi:GGDEF domain-containing protein
MSFSKWFRLWVSAFFKIFSYDKRKRKSDRQREKERLRRIKAKHSSANYYHSKKKRKRRRKSHEVDDEKIPIHIASGFAKFDYSKDSSFTDVFKRADDTMYENKRKSKIVSN